MKEHPILFTGPMVRALLDSSKTQTRRAVKTELVMGHESFCAKRKKGYAHVYLMHRDFDVVNMASDCPYGQPGDRLWVRESFAFTDAHMPRYEGSIEYRADNKCLAVSGNELVDVPHRCDPQPFQGPWKPSIHMPRWASRITLEITGVRVERLQDISEADAMAEGCVIHANEEPTYERKYRNAYRQLWQDINGPDSWQANPWVWVIEFKVVQP